MIVAFGSLRRYESATPAIAFLRKAATDAGLDVPELHVPVDAEPLSLHSFRANGELPTIKCSWKYGELAVIQLILLTRARASAPARPAVPG